MRHILITFILALFAVSVVGCGSDEPTMTSVDTDVPSEMAPNIFPTSWIDEIHLNEKIIRESKNWLGRALDENSGQCKVWVRTVVKNATGRNVPATSASDYSKWDPSPNFRVIWQGRNQCVTKFPSLQPGQIIQMKWIDSYMNGGPHTAIIKSAGSSSMEWYDSNYVGKLKVGSHPFTLKNWQKIEAWTVYQVN